MNNFQPPTPFNIADYFLDARLREGRGERIALRHSGGTVSYGELAAASNRVGNLLLEAGIQPGERVIIALPDGPGVGGDAGYRIPDIRWARKSLTARVEEYLMS